jgi:hypothetical protein
VRTLIVSLACLGALIGSGSIVIQGSIVVFDPAGVAQRMDVADGWGHLQRMSQIGRIYVLIGPREGGVRVLCRDGRVIEGGYVTRGAHEHLSLSRDGTCRGDRFRPISAARLRHPASA